jgi:Zn ribbon nucleic-acid-binding protein
MATVCPHITFQCSLQAKVVQWRSDHIVTATFKCGTHQQIIAQLVRESASEKVLEANVFEMTVCCACKQMLLK